MSTASPHPADTPLGGHQQLSHRVANYVREGIMAGLLPADEYLRTESLAAELSVSATPVREALMILQSEGSVRWEPRRGFRVVGITDDDVHDLFSVQAFIAGELAARAAARLSADDVEDLRRLQADLERYAHLGDASAVDRINFEIHRRINRASESGRLATLLKQTVQYVPLQFFGAIHGWAEASAHDHQPIFDALASGNADAARSAMTDHIVHIGELLVAHRRSNRSSTTGA